MKGRGGRKPHDVWKDVKKLNGDRVMCRHCEFEFAAPSATRISSHLYSIPNKGIRGCPKFGQAANGSSERDKNIARSCNLEVASRIASSTRELNKVNETRKGTTLQLQVDTKKKQISYQVGPFSISHYDEQDIQLIQYVFDPSGNPSEEVVIFPHYHLKRSEFTTLRPEADLNAMVIDAFAENLTKIEEEKMKIKPTRNWYLPLLFSRFALDSDESSCVERHNMKNDFMPSDLANCDKIFIPTHIGSNSCGHFYLYVVHLKRKVVEIWDSLPSYTTEKERNEKTQKLLLVLDKLFENDKSKSWAFAKFSPKMTENIPKQSNSYDCGTFVIKFMKDSANGMNNKLFESDKERLDLALELLKSELNKERETLFKKAALWYYVPHKEYQLMEDANHDPSIVIPQAFTDGNDLEIIGTEFDQVKSSGEEENKGHALRMNSMWRPIEHEVAGLAGKLRASVPVVLKLEVEVANLKAKSEKEKADLLAKNTALEVKAQEEASQFLNIKLDMEAKDNTISSLTAQLDSVKAQLDSVKAQSDLVKAQSDSHDFDEEFTKEMKKLIDELELETPEAELCNMYRVYGASNVAELLRDINSSQRKDAVKSLAYEAKARLRDPVYGCVGVISILNHQLRQLQTQLHLTMIEIASFTGPQAMLQAMLPNRAVDSYFLQFHEATNEEDNTVLLEDYV